MTLEALKEHGIEVPHDVQFEGDGGSGELGSATGLGFFGLMVHLDVCKTIMPFRQRPKHTHFICDQRGGTIRLGFLGNRKQYPRYSAFTPSDMLQNTRASMERMNPTVRGFLGRISLPTIFALDFNSSYRS